MAEQPKDPAFYALLSVAKVHLDAAWDAFRADDRIPWREMHGNVANLQSQIWVDALKETLEHHQQIEGLLS